MKTWTATFEQNCREVKLGMAAHLFYAVFHGIVAVKECFEQSTLDLAFCILQGKLAYHRHTARTVAHASMPRLSIEAARSP